MDTTEMVNGTNEASEWRVKATWTIRPSRQHSVCDQRTFKQFKNEKQNMNPNNNDCFNCSSNVQLWNVTKIERWMEMDEKIWRKKWKMRSKKMTGDWFKSAKWQRILGVGSSRTHTCCVRPWPPQRRLLGWAVLRYHGYLG